MVVNNVKAISDRVFRLHKPASPLRQLADRCLCGVHSTALEVVMSCSVVSLSCPRNYLPFVIFGRSPFTLLEFCPFQSCSVVFHSLRWNSCPFQSCSVVSPFIALEFVPELCCLISLSPCSNLCPFLSCSVTSHSLRWNSCPSLSYSVTSLSLHLKFWSWFASCSIMSFCCVWHFLLFCFVFRLVLFSGVVFVAC